MEITSPYSLWKDYDVTAMPLNVSELSAKTDGGLRIRELYFDGFTAVDGRVRTFMRIYERPSSKGIVLYMGDNIESMGGNTVHAMLDRGYSVAELDYAGKRYDDPRFTLYPATLDYCNCVGVSKFFAAADALSSKWYVWMCMARKALFLLRSMYEGSRIYALGKALGGSTVYKLAAFEDGPDACATMLNIIPDMSGTGNSMIVYRAALDTSAYAPIVKKPLFLSVCSNDQDGSLDKMAELAQTTTALKCFRIVERAFADSIKQVIDQTDHFFTDFADVNALIPQIKIKPVNSENNLYFNIKIDGNGSDETHSELHFYAAFCVKNPTIRNWTNIKTLNLGENEFMAHVDVLQNDKPVYAFINLHDENGNIVSSPLITVVPKTLGIPEHQAVKRRLIYDGSMGKDVWMSPGGGDVAVKSGPLGIDGISSSTNKLITFKPGDLLYSANEGALLQILINSKDPVIKITVSDGDEKYSCSINVPASDDWQKFTLSHTEFKGTSGTLSDWSKVIMFDFEGNDQFLINSVLWV